MISVWMFISVVAFSPLNCTLTFAARYLPYSCYRGREGPGASWQLTYLAGSNLPIAPLSFYVFRQIDCSNVYSYTRAPLRCFLADCLHRNMCATFPWEQFQPHKHISGMKLGCNFSKRRLTCMISEIHLHTM